MKELREITNDLNKTVEDLKKEKDIKKAVEELQQIKDNYKKRCWKRSRRNHQ